MNDTVIAIVGSIVGGLILTVLDILFGSGGKGTGPK